MPNNRYLLQKEKAFTREMYRFFNKSKRELQELLKKQDRQKSFNDDLNKLIEKIVLWSALILSKRAKPVLQKWSKETEKLNPDFSINFNLRNDPAVRYLDSLITLHTNTKINWSIWRTTYTRILWLVREWVSEWLSYTEVAEKITELDPLVFSKERAKNIAVSELWQAYEKWKVLPMEDLQAKWEIVLKKWQTVRDERVRPEHRANEADWYIPLDNPFSWTWSYTAPTWARCRCATIYKVL